MYYIEGADYDKLYAPYMRKDPLEMIGELPLKGQKVLDLCCGTGRFAKAAHASGAVVTIVDESQHMFPWDWQAENSIAGHCESVWKSLSAFAFQEKDFNLIVCQQAVNYWFDPFGAKQVFNILKPGGWFIFNTFNTPPSSIPTVRQYHDERITEVAYLINGVVHHIQTREGFAPHYTTFPWIAPSAFEDALTQVGFSVIADVRGRTTIWRAQKT